MSQQNSAATEPAPADSSVKGRAEQPAAKERVPRGLLLIGVVCSLLAMFNWLENRALASSKGRYEVQSRSLRQMQADVQHIRALAAVPQRASDHRRSSDELLAEIEQALQFAGVPLDRWQDSIPQPPQQLGNSPYKRVTTRLYFEEVSLEDIAGFAHRLVGKDASLFVSAIRISPSRNTERDLWNIELGVSYLVFG